MKKKRNLSFKLSNQCQTRHKKKQGENDTGKLNVTILSLSLVTVMSGAAVSDSPGTIAEDFIKTNSLPIKLIVTLPTLFIIFTSLFFSLILNRLSSKTITVICLLFYITGGCGTGFVDNIYLLSGIQKFFGIGVGPIVYFLIKMSKRN